VIGTGCYPGDLASGTAFFVGPDLLATAAHVVEDSAALVVDVDGQLVDAAVVGIDTREDLALLRVTAPSPGRELAFASHVPPVGSPHALVGFAAALSAGLGESFQVGTVSAIVPTFVGLDGVVLTDAVQSDVQSTPGSSGGPWVTPEGRVVGIDSHGVLSNISIAANGPAAAKKVAAWSKAPDPIRFC